MGDAASAGIAIKIHCHHISRVYCPVKHDDILILGCGFTGQRVARRFLARGSHVIATTRTPDRLASLTQLGADIITLDELGAYLRPGVLVLHSIPPAETDPSTGLVQHLHESFIFQPPPFMATLQSSMLQHPRI